MNLATPCHRFNQELTNILATLFHYLSTLPVSYHSDQLIVVVRDGRFGSKVGQMAPKWDTS